MIHGIIIAMKVCSKCKIEQPVENFSVNRSKRDGRQSYCNTCRKAWYSDYYHKGDVEKARILANNEKRRQENIEFLRSLKDKPCADCGMSYPAHVMDFDHLDGSQKTANVSSMAKWSRTAILREIAKCELVCSNCHRIRTHERRNPR